MSIVNPKRLSPSDVLAAHFLERAKEFNASVELIKVLKSRTYRIGETDVLVRAASEGDRRYFLALIILTLIYLAANYSYFC